MTIKTAFLPSAGLGKRLRPLTERLPKPLLPVNGVPMIEHVMRHCRDAGIERFIINTSYLPDAFEVAFPNHEWEGIPIEFVHEPIRLETGTGLKNVESRIGPKEPLLIYNSDILTSLSLEKIISAHEENGRPLVSLASSRLGPDLHLVTNDEQRLLTVDRNQKESTGNCFQFLGISIVEFDFLKYLQVENPESIIHGWMRALEDNSDSVHVIETKKGRWSDVGTLAAYNSFQNGGWNNNSLLLG